VGLYSPNNTFDKFASMANSYPNETKIGRILSFFIIAYTTAVHKPMYASAGNQVNGFSRTLYKTLEVSLTLAGATIDSGSMVHVCEI
jgi:hypothetical protein